MSRCLQARNQVHRWRYRTWKFITAFAGSEVTTLANSKVTPNRFADTCLNDFQGKTQNLPHKNIPSMQNNSTLNPKFERFEPTASTAQDGTGKPSLTIWCSKPNQFLTHLWANSNSKQQKRTCIIIKRLCTWIHPVTSTWHDCTTHLSIWNPHEAEVPSWFCILCRPTARVCVCVGCNPVLLGEMFQNNIL